MNKEQDSLPRLVAWGKRYDQFKDVSGTSVSLHVTSRAVCPHCDRFSYYCYGHSHRHPKTRMYAADEWRSAVIGFVPFEFRFAHSGMAGTATILCPRCDMVFGFQIPECAVRGYIDLCPLWPREVIIEPLKESSVQKRDMDLLRRSSGFENAHMSD